MQKAKDQEQADSASNDLELNQSGMEKNRRKSNPTKIERKSTNMAAELKEMPLGRKESSRAFFKNEIEWEKRRLQRMKHLKCCPRVPNRVLVALAMGDTGNVDAKSPNSSGFYGLDGKCTSDDPCSQILHGHSGETSEYLREHHVTHGDSLLVQSAGLQAGEKSEGICADSRINYEAENCIPSSGNTELCPDRECRNKNEGDSFDTEAFLSSAFGSSHPKATVGRDPKSDVSTMVREAHAVTASINPQFMPSQNIDHPNSNEYSERTTPDETLYAQNRSKTSDSQLGSDPGRIVETNTHVGDRDPRCNSPGLKAKVEIINRDRRNSADGNDMTCTKPLKVEICEEGNVQERPIKDEDAQSVDGRCLSATSSCDIELETSKCSEKLSTKFDGGPVINLVHSLDTQFPLPTIIKHAKENTSVSAGSNQGMRTGFIDLNSTKSAAQEHVLKSIRNMQYARGPSTYSAGSFIMLESRDRAETGDYHGHDERLRRMSPSSAGLTLSLNSDGLHTNRAGERLEGEAVASETEGGASPFDKAPPFTLGAERDSYGPHNESPRSSESGSEHKSPRPFPSGTKSPHDGRLHADMSTSRMHTFTGNNRAMSSKRSEIHSKSGVIHLEGPFHRDEPGLPRVSSYRGYDPVFDRLPERSANRGPNLTMRNFGIPKRVHPDFQSLGSTEFRDMSFTVQEGSGAAKLPRPDSASIAETRDTPLANSHNQKAKLTSFVTPHQNQSLTFRRSVDRPIQPARNHLVPRVIGEENVSNLFDPLEISPNKLSMWTSQDVCRFLEQTDCREYANVFLQQEIDGKTLLVLTEEQISRLLKIKIGPSIKIYTHIANLKNILSHL